MSTELTDLLRAGMERVPATVPPGLAGRAYRRYRRRRARTRIAAMTGTAGIVAGAAAFAVAGSGGPGRPAAANAPTAAYVADQMVRAVDATAPDTVVHVQRRTPNGLRESWDIKGLSRDESFGADGRPIIDYAADFTASGHTITSVDYQKRTWFRYTRANPALAGGQAGGFTPACEYPLGLTFLAPVPEAAQLRAWVTCGKLRLGKTGVADGIRAISLTGERGQVTFTYWVDASTYLPVRQTLTPRSDPVRVLSQSDYQWLAATPANLAELVVPVPAGFTRVPPPALSD